MVDLSMANCECHNQKTLWGGLSGSLAKKNQGISPIIALNNRPSKKGTPNKKAFFRRPDIFIPYSQTYKKNLRTIMYIYISTYVHNILYVYTYI